MAMHLAKWRCTVRLLQRPRGQEQRAPCLRRTCCLAGLSSLLFVGVRIKRPTGRGGLAVRPRTPRGTAVILHPCLPVRWHPRGESDRRRSKGFRYKLSNYRGWGASVRDSRHEFQRRDLRNRQLRFVPVSRTCTHLKSVNFNTTDATTGATRHCYCPRSAVCNH